MAKPASTLGSKPGLITERWGEKAPAKGRGYVVGISGCSFETKGTYTWSTSNAIIGRKMIYKMTLIAPTLLQGEWYGAARIWLPVSWQKQN